MRFHPDYGETGLHAGMFIAFLVVLAWLPVPLGSNRPWSLALMSACIAALMGCWALAYAHRPFTLPGTIRAARLPLVLLVSWTTFGLLQLVPVPVPVAEHLGGDAHRLYSQLPGATDNTTVYLSLDRDATLAGFFRHASMVAVFCLVLALTTTMRRLRLLLIVLFAVGFLESLYALVLHFGGKDTGLWDPGYIEGALAGTYVNQNHFAGLLELTIAVGLGLLLSQMRSGISVNARRAFFRHFLEFVTGARAVTMFCLAIMIGVLLMSTSRGAIGGLAIGVLATLTLGIARRGWQSREARMAVVVAPVAVTAALWLGVGGLAEKLEISGLESNRGDLREVSYRMIAASPVLGTGIGTFRWGFPHYKDERFGTAFYEHAHNDYLEIIVEQGIVGFTLFVTALTILIGRLCTAFRRRQDPLVHGALFSGLSGSIALLTHGMVDFNLQIPANAAYFMALLGAATAAIELGRHGAAHPEPSRSSFT